MFRIIRRRASMPKALKESFSSYEAARSAIRKWIRESQGNFKRFTKAGRGELLYNNPSISAFGFSITKN